MRMLEQHALLHILCSLIRLICFFYSLDSPAIVPSLPVYMGTTHDAWAFEFIDPNFHAYLGKLRTRAKV